MSGFDVNSPSIWSGTPFHLLQVCIDRGLLDEGLATSFPSGLGYKTRRWAWNARKWLRTGEYGGFSASGDFHNLVWGPVMHRLRGAALITCGNYIAPRVVDDNSIDKWFFIDQTLRQYYDYPDAQIYWGSKTREEIFRREADAYQAATGVIVNSRWAAESVIRDCGVATERVHIMIQGANIPGPVYREWERSISPEFLTASLDRPRPLTLVCVSRVYYRKGIDRLVGAYRIARLQGFRGTLRIIGYSAADAPENVRNLDGIEWLGHVDKRREMRRFIDLVASADVGCLLSRFEAGGIALREYHALGIPTMGTDAGGAPEQLNPEASFVVPRTATDEQVAGILLELQSDWSNFRAMKLKAWETRHAGLWDHSVKRMSSFWSYC